MLCLGPQLLRVSAVLRLHRLSKKRTLSPAVGVSSHLPFQIGDDCLELLPRAINNVPRIPFAAYCAALPARISSAAVPGNPFSCSAGLGVRPPEKRLHRRMYSTHACNNTLPVVRIGAVRSAISSVCCPFSQEPSPLSALRSSQAGFQRPFCSGELSLPSSGGSHQPPVRQF